MENQTLEEKLQNAKDNIELGALGEELAARYLELKGLKILNRNWKCDFGEADIIAKDEGDTVCFIEVKTRRGVEAGLPEEAITQKKRSRYERIALCYMMENRLDDMTPIRFDSVAICVVYGVSRALLRHHKNFFSAGI